MTYVSIASACALIVAALWLAQLYDAAYGARRAQPLPRCLVAVGGQSSWYVCW